MRNDITARRLRRFGPHVLFHVTSDLNRVLLDDEISGFEGVHLTSDPQRAIALAGQETGPRAGIIVLDRLLLEMDGPTSLPLEVTVGLKEFEIEGVYPLSWYAAGLFRLGHEPEPLAEQRFGWQLMVQFAAMQRLYANRRVARENIEPFYQLLHATMDHLLSRHDLETYGQRLYDAFLANSQSAQRALEHFKNAADSTASSALTMH